MCETPVIAIVDDDEAVRVATGSLVRSLGYTAETYASAGDFLRACAEREPACLITDVQMPGMSGVELQQSLIAAGASGFLQKPCDGDTIIRSLQRALAGRATA